jgi:(S)-sulfolactate dehydrogenase
MPRILITEFMDGCAVDELRSAFDVHYDPDLFQRPEALAPEAQDCDALIVRNRTQVDAKLVADAARLRVIGRLGVGLDNIDVAACESRGVEVIPARGANALAVAEYVIATALMLLRGAYFDSRDVASGRWPRSRLSEGREIAGKTLGLVGFGDISRLTGRLARALDMRVIAHDPFIAPNDPVWAQESTTPRPLDVLLMTADVVSLHLPLNDATRNLFNAEVLGRMKSDAVLINTSRGHIVDEAALAARLRAGKLAGAAVDVYGEEPLPAGSALADVPNLILTPHIGGVTAESNERVSRMIAEKVREALQRRS